MSRVPRLVPALLALSLPLAACARPGVEESSTTVPRSTSATAPTSTSPGATSSDPTSSPSTTAASPETSATPAGTSCRAMAAALPVEQQVGQLIMVGVDSDSLSSEQNTALTTHHVGSVVLLGHDFTSRMQVSVLTSQLAGVNEQVPVLVSVDQEGGQIQRLSGDGFSTIPSAPNQAKIGAGPLVAAWAKWGGELARAGVLYNLAPVADVVPESKVSSNAPIGQLRRHYGTTPQAASPLVVSAVQGMQKAGVATSLKHFPGLGEVTTNTDFGKATDDVTGPDSPSLQVFADGIKAGASSVMVSSAVYPKIDPDHRAVFSSKVITGLLRQKMGYQGVVISDDLGAAASVKEVAPRDRALQFVAAGGDLVINADAASVPAMATGLVAQAKADPAFAQQITDSAGRVLKLKAEVGLVTCS